MSKIPQGEWNAIAARYKSGESISEIARSYGCTPPAIHYILKRNRQQVPEIGPQLAALPAEVAVGLVRARTPRPASTSAQHAPALPSVTSGEALGRPSAGASVPGLGKGSDSPRPVLVRARVPEPQTAAASDSDQFLNGTPRSAVARGNIPEPAGKLPVAAPPGLGTMILVPVPGSSGAREPGPALGPQSAAKPALLPGLDNELHLRAEAAIALFRSSFDAALSEGSPSVRERLRQAASDLMRVAARTTIVLDRLNAGAERASARAQNYPRSAHAGEDFGKFG
jgi:hypothetical protein